MVRDFGLENLIIDSVGYIRPDNVQTQYLNFYFRMIPPFTKNTSYKYKLEKDRMCFIKVAKELLEVVTRKKFQGNFKNIREISQKGPNTYNGSLKRLKYALDSILS